MAPSDVRPRAFKVVFPAGQGTPFFLQAEAAIPSLAGGGASSSGKGGPPPPAPGPSVADWTRALEAAREKGAPRSKRELLALRSRSQRGGLGGGLMASSHSSLGSSDGEGAMYAHANPALGDGPVARRTRS